MAADNLTYYWDFTSINDTFSDGDTVVTDDIGSIDANVDGPGDLICNTNGLIWVDDRTSNTKPELKIEGIDLSGNRTIEFVYKSDVSAHSWDRRLIQFSNWGMFDWNTCEPTGSECGLWLREVSSNSFIMSMDNPWGNTVERDCPGFVHIIMTWTPDEGVDSFPDQYNGRFTWYINGFEVSEVGGKNPNPYGIPESNDSTNIIINNNNNTRFGGALKYIKIYDGELTTSQVEAVYDDYIASIVEFKPTSNTDLQEAVNSWIDDNITALSTYGDINTWETCLITDMSELFKNKTAFNDDISNWDTSNVIDMRSMFEGVEDFDQTIYRWDVSKVVNMSRLFTAATSFNQDLSNWNVSKVSDMTSMFEGTISFDQDLSNWDLSSVIAITKMFKGAEAFNCLEESMGDWLKTSIINNNLKDFTELFSGAVSFNMSLDNWDTSHITNMYGMFYDATVFNNDIINWDVSKVLDMESMFASATDFNQDIRNWTTILVTTMNTMFYEATTFNQNISTSSNKWNVNSVNDMAYMFYGATDFNQDIGNWDVSYVNSMESMFEDASIFNQDLSNWDMNEVHTIAKMFKNAGAFNCNSTSMENWLDNTVIHSDLKDFTELFSGATSFNASVENWDVSYVNSMESMFEDASIFNQDLSNWDMNEVHTIAKMFKNAGAFNCNSTSMENWLDNTVIHSDLKDFTELFSGATSFNASVENWDTSNITNMKYMFSETLFNNMLDKWDVSKVENFQSIFEDAAVFNQDISMWDMSNVKFISNMFKEASSFSCLCVSMEDWLNNSVIHNALTDFTGLFNGASNFNVSLKNWDTANITSMNSMFKNATQFNKDLTNINVENVDDMSGMFCGAELFNQNIRMWDVKSTTILSNMFIDASGMIKIYGDLSYFNLGIPDYRFFNKRDLLYFWDFRNQNYRNSWKDSLGTIYDLQSNKIAIIKRHGITTSTVVRKGDGIHLNNLDYNASTNTGGVYIDLIGLDDTSNISRNFTIEIVAKFNSVSRMGIDGISSGNLFDFSNNNNTNRIYARNTGGSNKQLELRINNTDDISGGVYSYTNTIDTLNFQHFVYIVDENEVKIYVNGQYKSENSYMGFNINLVENLREHYLLGSNYNFNGNNYFNGIIKYIRIYKGAMLPSEVSNYWAGGNSLKDRLSWTELDICTPEPVVDTTTSCPAELSSSPIPIIQGIPNVSATRGPPSSSRPLNTRVFLRIPPHF